ncbi:Chemotaxis response - phosphatase CheZ [hydrothermal vent metagenome]|uniref:Protein phosphatase CheZ n=1 Tax=hydrothermal vent metagenome TaxID=652676 RepID=A0A3B0WKX3_9ZZZZ
MQNATKATLPCEPMLNKNLNESLNENLKQAKQLVAHLEAGDTCQADLVINELCLSRENNIFQDLGKLTRELHETINDIGDDARLKDLMDSEISDARHNLDHVIELTENAANQTLTAVEQSSSVLENLSERAVYLQRLLHGHMKKLNDDNKLSFIEEELEGFLDKVRVDIKHVNKNMNTILMAQSYQDISGQIIQRVGKMIQDVEHSLIGILKINSSSVSHNNNDNKQSSKTSKNKNRTGYGPAVPAIKTNDTLNNQNDVDDLLSTLGF